MIIPIRNQDADTIARKFVDQIVLRFEIPEIVFSDLGALLSQNL